MPVLNFLVAATPLVSVRTFHISSLHHILLTVLISEDNPTTPPSSLYPSKLQQPPRRLASVLTTQIVHPCSINPFKILYSEPSLIIGFGHGADELLFQRTLHKSPMKFEGKTVDIFRSLNLSWHKSLLYTYIFFIASCSEEYYMQNRWPEEIEISLFEYAGELRIIIITKVTGSSLNYNATWTLAWTHT